MYIIVYFSSFIYTDIHVTYIRVRHVFFIRYRHVFLVANLTTVQYSHAGGVPSQG